MGSDPDGCSFCFFLPIPLESDVDHLSTKAYKNFKEAWKRFRKVPSL